MCMSVCKFNVTIREIERVYVCVCVCERKREREIELVGAKERGRERMEIL